MNKDFNINNYVGMYLHSNNKTYAFDLMSKGVKVTIYNGHKIKTLLIQPILFEKYINKITDNRSVIEKRKTLLPIRTEVNKSNLTSTWSKIYRAKKQDLYCGII